MRKKWSREFTSYAISQGRTPAAQIKHDKEEWPGGCMCGFILWMSEAIRLFKKENPRAFIGPVIWDHEAKNTFLRKYSKKEVDKDEFV